MVDRLIHYEKAGPEGANIDERLWSRGDCEGLVHFNMVSFVCSLEGLCMFQVFRRTTETRFACSSRVQKGIVLIVA